MLKFIKKTVYPCPFRFPEILFWREGIQKVIECLGLRTRGYVIIIKIHAASVKVLLTVVRKKYHWFVSEKIINVNTGIIGDQAVKDIQNTGDIFSLFISKKTNSFSKIWSSRTLFGNMSPYKKQHVLFIKKCLQLFLICLLYTSDAADE